MSLKRFAPFLAIIALFSIPIVSGVRDTINNWELRNYYNRAILQYGDINNNGEIEKKEGEAFRDSLETDIRNEPGYEDFFWRENTHIAYNPNAKNLLNLIRKYRPIN